MRPYIVASGVFALGLASVTGAGSLPYLALFVALWYAAPPG